MTGNISALQTAWSTLEGTTAQKLVLLNAATAIGPPQDIKVGTLKNFLNANGLIVAANSYVANGTNTDALLGCNYILALLVTPPMANGMPYSYVAANNFMLQTSLPANFAAIQTLAPGLLADPLTGWTVALLNQMIAIIAPPVPWWQANGFSGPITVTDLIAAGDLF